MGLSLIRESGGDLDLAIKTIAQMRSVGLDTETTGLDPYSSKILLVQMGNKDMQWVFDVARIGEAKLAAKLKPILENENITKILHNAKFDYKMFAVNFDTRIENIHCTYVTEQILTCGLKTYGFGLKDVIEKYLRITLDKFEQSSFQHMKYGDEFSEDQLIYAATDIAYLNDVAEEQIKLIKKYDLQTVYQVEMDVLSAIADMELNGVHLDKNTWLMAEEDAKLNRILAMNDLNEQFKPYCGLDLFGNPVINYNSPKQLLPLLKKIIGKDARHLKGTGEPEIKDIDHPCVAALLNYREAEKRVSTYGREFFENINPVTGLIHTTFNQCQTDTGRLSSNSPERNRGTCLNM